MSAEACLAALFIPSGNQKWNDDLEWQPVPVHVQPANQDYVVATQKKCDRFDYEMLKYINGSEYQSIFKQYQPLIDYMRVNTKMKLSSILQILTVYDILFVEKLKGLWQVNSKHVCNECLFNNYECCDFSLPDWAERVMTPGGDLEQIAKFFYKMYTATDFMKQIKAGFLIKEIFDRASSKIQSKLKPDRTLWMYFAHDITITNVLNSLGLYKVTIA